MPSSTEMSHDSPPERRGLHAWLDKLGLGRPELRAWAMYDWANSAMACTIVTAVFPVYLRVGRLRGHDRKNGPPSGSASGPPSRWS